MFNTLVAKYSQEREGFKLREDELTELIKEATASQHEHPSVWFQFKAILLTKTELKKDQANAIFKKARITSDLGREIYGINDFVPAFVSSRHLVMNFSGQFNDDDLNAVLDKMLIWSNEIVSGQTIYTEQLLRSGLNEWMRAEKKRLLIKQTVALSFDANADKTQLRKFAELITAQTGEDPIADSKAVRATEIALANFIFRTKNHIRRQWHHGAHMMPVLHGSQGSGKSTAVDLLLAPLRKASMVGKVGADMFAHDAKMYALATVPVMFFDELAGFDRAQIERVKDVMLAEERELRELRQAPVTKKLVSTFIGCTNEEVSEVIKDKTGNRRFFQITTPERIDLESLRQIDVMAIWKSVDEDAEAPLFANARDLDIVQTIQASQRFKTEVEVWIDEHEGTGQRGFTSSDLFTVHFVQWLDEMYPCKRQFHNANNFGKALNKLLREKHPRLTRKRDRKDGHVWIIADQSTGPSQPRFTPFSGKKASQ